MLQAVLREHVSSPLPPVAPVIPMPVGDDGMPWGFRHKSAFVFGPAPGGGLVMGHFAEGGREIVPVDECPVHSPRANRIAFALRDELARARVSAAGLHLDGVLRHLIVRTSSDDRDAIAMLVVTRNAAELRTPIRALLASSDRPDGMFVNLHPRPSPYMVGRETLRIDGHAHVRERRLGPTFLVSPTAFFQTNPTAAAALVSLVLEHASGERLRVIDLYAGSGLFTVPLVARGHRITSVEENATAVADAAKNLEVNRLDARAVRLVCERVESVLPRLEGHMTDLVVLDPPREGCSAAVLRSVFGRMAPPRAVYVSCNASALAAELPTILAAGYRVVTIQPVDMFPHTPHVETVVVFDRVSTPSRSKMPPIRQGRATKSAKMKRRQ